MATENNFTSSATVSKLSNVSATSNGFEISSWDLMLTEYTLNCAVVMALAVFGIFGNIISIIILSRHGLNKTTNIFLVSLSFSDLLLSIFSFFKAIRYLIILFGPLYEYYGRFIRAFSTQASEIATAISILHITAISVERMVAVSFPFHVSKIFTAFRVRCVVIFLYFYAFFTYLPTFTFTTIKFKYSTVYNTTILVMPYSDYFISNFSTIMINVVFSLSLGLILFPLCVTVICTIIIILQLQLRKTKALSKNASTQTKGKKVIRILLIHSLLGVLFFLPSSVVDMYRIVYVGKSSAFYDFYQYIPPVLYQLNASINFIIYITKSSKFAATYDSLFKRKS